MVMNQRSQYKRHIVANSGLLILIYKDLHQSNKHKKLSTQFQNLQRISLNQEHHLEREKKMLISCSNNARIYFLKRYVKLRYVTLCYVILLCCQLQI